MLDRTDMLWSANDEGGPLCCTTPEEAVEWALDAHPDPLPREVVVHGYALSNPSQKELEGEFIEQFVEWAYENYSHDDGPEIDVTETMITAEDTFIAVLLDEFTSSSYEHVTEKTMDAVAWVRVNRPTWDVTFEKDEG